MGYCPICKREPIAPSCESCPGCGNTEWYEKTGLERTHTECSTCDGKGEIFHAPEISWRPSRPGEHMRTCFTCQGSKKGHWTEYQVVDTRTGKLYWKSDDPNKWGKWVEV